jgi:hypothetical protein
MSITDEIVGIVVDTKSRLCQVHPMADIEYPLLHVVDMTGEHHAMVLAAPAGSTVAPAEVADAVRAAMPGIEPAVVGVVTECYARPRADEPAPWTGASMRAEYETVPDSTVTPALVVCTVTCTNIRTVRLLPYSWDDQGRPVWRKPQEIGTVAGDVAELVELASILAGVQ